MECMEWLVFIWSLNVFDPFPKTRCTGYTIKSMGDRVSCYYSLCHLFIHPATISTHQEYLPIFKTMWTPPLYPYCSSYWEIKSVLTAKYPFDDGMSHFITLKLTTWTRDSWVILLPLKRELLFWLQLALCLQMKYFHFLYNVLSNFESAN